MANFMSVMPKSNQKTRSIRSYDDKNKNAELQDEIPKTNCESPHMNLVNKMENDTMNCSDEAKGGEYKR